MGPELPGGAIMLTSLQWDVNDEEGDRKQSLWVTTPVQSQPCTAVTQIRLSGHEAPSTKLLHLVLAKFGLHLSWQTCSRMAHEGLSPGPLSITNQVLWASRPILSCVVLRSAPSFQPLLKMCFPESLPQATSSAPGLARPYSHDFQQLHMDFPNFTNIQTSSKGEKYPQTPLHVSKIRGMLS